MRNIVFVVVICAVLAYALRFNWEIAKSMSRDPDGRRNPKRAKWIWGLSTALIVTFMVIFVVVDARSG